MVRNVSSLVPDQSLNFDPNGLTVVYGDNGAGKSSYAKILKSACLTRGDVPNILTNVFKPSTEKPQATLNFSSAGGEPTPYVWEKDGEDSPELKSIRIFDSKSAVHYISKEDSIEYKPAELKLLDELVSVCLEVKRRLLGEQKHHSAPHPIFGYNPSTKVNGFIQSLNNLPIAESTRTLDFHCATDEEIDQIEPLKLEIVELTGKTPEQLKKELAGRYGHREPLYKFIINLIFQLSDDNLSKIGRLYDEKISKVAAAEAIRQTTLTGLPIGEIGTEVWKEMWRHVEGFITSQNGSFPPVAGENCPTCLQVIDTDTAERMKTFHNYIQDQSQVEAQKATQAYQARIQFIENLSFDLSHFTGILTEIEAVKPEVKIALDVLMEQLTNRKQAVLSATPCFIQPPLILNVPNWLKAQLDSLQAKIESVADDGSLARSLAEKNSRLLELQDRQTIRQQKQSVLNEINRLYTFQRFQNALGSVVLTRVTSFTSVLSNAGGIGQLKGMFESELSALGFKAFPVETKTRGSAGEQKLKLAISNITSTKISDIASEGEQKCIALAGFMSELTIDNRKSAIIFDDPVNSLDHKWRRLFAKRIAVESLHRQVIVLTHDLPFLVMLREAAKETSFNLLHIAQRGPYSGFPVGRLPWDAMSTKDRIKFLRQQVVDVRRYCKDFENFIEEDYKEKARYVYGKLRTTLERLIEEWLIGDIVQRFSRDVRATMIAKLLKVSESEITFITSIYDKCCGFLDAHDNPANAGVVPMPDIDELKQDIEDLAAFFEEVKNNRK
ncbi:ATPase, possibly involved in inorganic ion transport [Shewanella sediminis HAW-EB3]|uniref:ATPase, possibly involved in inorganic ion transport n=1 Tax=Shewanella sediminis (strain HAW-EB3) TaxID=425104 RepID=A8FQY2_SHESH|nr:AAA family ATPase [Shewanella sediminis]ABV35255.1 ATPase, possibly involved in inorganic ion transport [Shewanella sediminis HAW-EB3]